ncbi:glycoside hydrolase family 99-like domain-containing protein [Mucilaginibacter boryungensis]|uniref:Glycoside hydrolase family 99-like domain-containing protein n=2 Tax=Mucilaginibacter boryungensis TaxID=768480 RepID=A0ABR9XKZ8_9SPHI|nr:glycoside hydrolase family 99-like domain-containing protein [Mucilaginibacter boryungensis]
MLFVALFFCLFTIQGCTQSHKITSNVEPCIGAYYFDGWTKDTNNSHLTKSLIEDYSFRKPIWGWVTSKQSIIDAQINAAANAGLSFFSFCWYYNTSKPIDSLNRGLMLYNKSSVKKRLKFCLLVANHAGSLIGTKEWPVVVKEWIKQFKSGNYLTVNKKPLIVFFSVKSLIENFGSADLVHKAFDSLKLEANKVGLAGVSIAACLGPGRNETSVAEDCGFDVLTGYNYCNVGFIKGQQEAPIENLRVEEYKIWDMFPKVSNLKYIPVSTLNWDPRPWADTQNNYMKKPYFIGYSAQSVYASVKGCVKWLNDNADYATPEKIAVLYAWNEYGEGGYLTPTESKKIEPYNGLKWALGLKQKQSIRK